MNSKNLLVLFGIFFVVLCNSIVYGTLNTDMFIDGDAYVRVDRNIRVTGIKVLEQNDGAYETYNCNHSKDTTSIQATLPSSDSFIVYEVTITNKGDIDYEVSNIVEESYSNSNIKYEIIDLEKGTVIDGETTYTFKIKLTTTKSDSENKGTLVLKYTFEEWKPSLYKMMAHKSRSLDTDIDFGVAPTKETSGVYEMNSTKDDEYPVYYYRGMVENNNVSFAGFCWKAVRTTSTGGVKLIYNGVPAEDGSCDNTGTSSFAAQSNYNYSYTYSRYVGYMYDSSTNSTIKSKVDAWYQSNMMNYTNILEDTLWCNNRVISYSEGVTSRYVSYQRLEAAPHKGVITCSNKEDSFTVGTNTGNGKLTYPVALLTSDEASLAGCLLNNASTSYLISDGSYWWTMSPSENYYADALVFFVNSDGKLISQWTSAFGNLDGGVRPAISLKPGTMVSDGNGKVSSPYEVFLDENLS